MDLTSYIDSRINKSSIEEAVSSGRNSIGTKDVADDPKLLPEFLDSIGFERLDGDRLDYDPKNPQYIEYYRGTENSRYIVEFKFRSKKYRRKYWGTMIFNLSGHPFSIVIRMVDVNGPKNPQEIFNSTDDYTELVKMLEYIEEIA